MFTRAETAVTKNVLNDISTTNAISLAKKMLRAYHSSALILVCTKEYYSVIQLVAGLYCGWAALQLKYRVGPQETAIERERKYATAKRGKVPCLAVCA